MESKIIQIIYHTEKNCIYALLNDGSIWTQLDNGFWDIVETDNIFEQIKELDKMTD